MNKSPQYHNNCARPSHCARLAVVGLLDAGRSGARTIVAAGRTKRRLLCVLPALLAMCSCATSKSHHDAARADIPRELQKVTLPPYVIEPPDILVIGVTRALPKPPYRIQTLDVIYVEDNVPPVPAAPPKDTGLPPLGDPYSKIRFTGNYSVEPGGTIDLGPLYGRVQVGGLTIEEAHRAIQRRVNDQKLKDVNVQRVSLVQMAGVEQQIAGEHLVTPDGTISLGTYGRVHVTGMTLEQAKYAIEAQLSAFLDSPQVSVDVFAYNSKVYYVITQGTVAGDGVHRLPVTGNETVLDAISQIQGLQPHSSRHIWLARPAPPGSPCADQVLAVDWLAVSKLGSTATNYQIMPGDRIYVAEDPWITLDGAIAKITSPFERLFGFTTLGTGMLKQIKFFNRANTGGGGGI